MTIDSFFLLVTMAFAAAFTPGPNNVMLASSGATFGFRRTFPHIAGVMVGFPVMILCVGFFLGQVFEASVFLREGLRWAGAGLLLWIAWKIATAGGIGSTGGVSRPMRFIESAGFQWINPKGWAMTVALTSQFVTAGNSTTVVPIIAAVFVVMGIGSASLWAAIGTSLAKWLRTGNRLQWFNRAMALLIVASIAILFLD